MKKVFGIILTLAILLTGLTGSGLAEGENGTLFVSFPTGNIRIAINILAQQKGYFTEEGVTVQEVNLGGARSGAARLPTRRAPNSRDGFTPPEAPDIYPRRRRSRRQGKFGMHDDTPPANDEGLRARIAEMRQEHQDLDAAVEALESLPMPDQLQIARLKKKKLGLRDEIQRLEDQLTPDIIA